MHKLRIFAVIAALIALTGIAASFQAPVASGTYIFKGIEGPRDVSRIRAPVNARWQDYVGGSDSRLAVLLTDTNSSWLGIAHGLKAAGIPFSISTDYREAVKHKVIFVYPMMTAATVNSSALQALSNFTRDGGTLIGSEVLGGGAQEIFGFTKAMPFNYRRWLIFKHPAADADANEKQIPIDNPEATNPMGAYGYSAAKDPPMAVYEDGSAAITDHKFGNGRALAIGFDIGALLLKGYENRQENMARSYDNGYEPALDVLLRFIGDIYRQGEPRAVIMAPVPDGKKLAVILTHDIDYTRSLANALDYAQFEHEAGIRATYFMQTKYIRDYNDDVILGADSPAILKQLHDLGMEIGSHTVSHSHEFRHFPIGDGTESYPAYHPFVQSRDTYTGGTIFGELRVSRFLIEQLVPDLHVASFRPGYLSDPYMLPQALVATDYKYSSSVTANDSLTHLPFQLTYSRENNAAVPVYEFPIAIADGPPLLSDRLPEGIGLAKKIARHGGLCVILIHPDVVEPKLGFEKKFVAQVKDFSWFGTIEQFGDWWTARDAVQVDSEQRVEKLILHIKASKPIDGLTLVPPSGFHFASGQPTILENKEHSVVLRHLAGEVDLTLSP